MTSGRRGRTSRGKTMSTITTKQTTTVTVPEPQGMLAATLHDWFGLSTANAERISTAIIAAAGAGIVMFLQTIGSPII